MFNDSLAWFFRTVNTRLLYTKFWLEEKFVKVIFLLSIRFYKSWMKSQQKPSSYVLHNIDKNLVMKVDLSKSMGAAFYWMGFHELNEWRFLNTFLKEDMVFVDIGSNQGEFALFSAKRLTKGSVLAFEPVNFFYDLLNQNISLNQFRNIKTFHCGLSDVAKQLPIYMGSEGEGENEGLGSVFQSKKRNRFIQNIDLKVFDDMVTELNVARIDFMKIDVEGAELMVLNGSKEAIRKFRPHVMIEISEETYRAAGYSVSDVKSFFKPLNYSLHIISKGGILKRSESTPDFCNAVFVPND